MNIQDTQQPNTTTAIDGETQKLIAALVAGAVQTQPRKFCCLVGMDLNRLKPSQRAALEEVIQSAEYLAAVSMEPRWATAGRSLRKALSTMATK